MSFRHLSFVVAAVAFLGIQSSAHADFVPTPVVSVGSDSVKLESTGGFCWKESASDGSTHTVCSEQASGNKPPDGTLHFGSRRTVRIDMGRPTTWVRMGKFRAHRVDTSGRYWAVDVGRRHFRKQVRVLAGFDNQAQGSYAFGPVVLAP